MVVENSGGILCWNHRIRYYKTEHEGVLQC